MPTISAAGTSVSYACVGQGPGLVLVAGWPSPHDARHQLAFDLWQQLEQADHDLFSQYRQLTCFFEQAHDVKPADQLQVGTHSTL